MKGNFLRLLLVNLVLLAALLLTDCAREIKPESLGRSPAATATPQLDMPRLRINNDGTTDIQNLTVIFPDSRIHFGDIPAGATTEYQPAPKGVYNYAAYEYRLDGKTVSQPVIDWVGESPRPGTTYTYVIEVDENAPLMGRIKLQQVSVP